MKVLWLLNFVPAPLADDLGLPRQASGSWVGALRQALAGHPVQLALAAYTPAVSNLHQCTAEGCTYFAIPAGGGKDALQAALDAFGPDLVQVFGTENIHARWAMELFGPHRTLLYIQGLAGPCAEHMADGLPPRFLRRQPLKELLSTRTGGATVRQITENLRMQGQAEAAAIGMADHVLGRTAWDRETVQAIHPGCHYHTCGEIMRPAFYEGAWKSLGTHRIFMSQGNIPLKGLHRAIQALPGLMQRWPDTELVIAGWPPVDKGPLLRPFMNWLAEYQGWLAKTAHTLGVENRIRWLGVLNAEAMKQEFLRSDVYLMPSSLENSPNSLAEAMLLGLPCAAANVGGVPSMMTDGQEGVLFDPAAPGTLEAAVADLWADPDRAARLGRNAAARARADHDPASIAADVMQLYQSVLEE